MIPIYSCSRQVYICKVNRAAKDNKVVKKGESYLWVKVNKYSQKELFKNEAELDKKYPKKYNITEPGLANLLRAYKKELKINSRLSPKEFLKTIL